MFEIKINTDGAAFYNFDGEHDPPLEIARILMGIVGKMANGIGGGDLHDSNGNLVGEWTLDDRQIPLT